MRVAPERVGARLLLVAEQADDDRSGRSRGGRAEARALGCGGGAMSFVADRVDAVLEWSVVGSFTRVGSALRRRLDQWAPLDGGRLAGRRVNSKVDGVAAWPWKSFLTALWRDTFFTE
jgi:hypothetical protein